MIVLAQNRCPLCGGRILHGECADCGYRLPDEDKLSAPYNLDPEDDRPEASEPAPEKYEMPEMKPFTAQNYEENAAERVKPNIKVAPTQTPFNNPYSPNNVQNNQSAQPNNQNNRQGWQNPYNYKPAQQPNRNPINPTSPTKSNNGVLATLVILFILAFFAPFFGVIGLCLNGSFGKSLDMKTKKLFTILYIFAIAVSVLAKS